MIPIILLIFSIKLRNHLTSSGGHHFLLWMDYKALTTLLATKGIGHAGMRVERCSAQLLCISSRCVPGAQNPAARLMIKNALTSNGWGTFRKPENGLSSHPQDHLHCPWRTSQQLLNPVLSCLLWTQILKGWTPNRKNVQRQLSSFFLIHDELSVHDGLIMWGEHHFIKPAVAN